MIDRSIGARAAMTALAIAAALTGASAARAQTTTNPPTAMRSNAMTMQTDLTNRAPEIHWPEGFSPETADLFSHNELHIDAPCERVWKHIVAATKWPQWYPNAKDVRILNGDGLTLKAGSVFRWSTFGLPLESRVHEFTPFSRMGWFGYAPGEAPSFYHTWYLAPEGDGCHVVTDEVGRGPGAAQMRLSDESGMHRGHDLWLATLKWMAEAR